jgi:type II secretory pathway pseudopilin PulG
MVVIAIMVVVAAFIAPAFTALKGACDVTSAAYTIKGVLDQARTYAMANNTYVWVGFYEENTTDTAPTSTTPPYLGKGRVLLAVVYSQDGTSTLAVSPPQIGKLTKIEGIHLTDIGPPPSPTPLPTPEASSLAARSGLPYTSGSPSTDYQNRISSDDAHSPFNFTVQGYTFYKTIRFGPRGEANINSTYSLKNVAEIGLRPTHGTTVDTITLNVVAIQFSGVGGTVKIYRR